ncbi:MAG: response regulator, partial [Pseudomonadota bacterium]
MLNKVLLVDDSEDDQYIADYMIRKVWPGCEVIMADDGIEAMGVLDTTLDAPPDLMLLDLNMPRMNGLEMLKSWYSESESKPPPVVVLTSSDAPDDRREALRFPSVQHYLLKP